MLVIDPCDPKGYKIVGNLKWVGVDTLTADQSIKWYDIDLHGKLTKTQIVDIVTKSYGTPSQFFEGNKWPVDSDLEYEKCYLMLAKAKPVGTEEEVVLIGTNKQRTIKLEQEEVYVVDVWDFDAFAWIDEKTKRVRSFEDRDALFELTHLVGRFKPVFNHRTNTRDDTESPSFEN